jgi:ribose transport system substrate-binding protein
VKSKQYFTPFVFIVLLLLLVPVLVACGGETPTDGNQLPGGKKGPFTIGISNGFVASEWRTQMLEDMKATNEEYKKAGLAHDLVIESADVQIPGQIQQIQNLINKKVDAIIINPNSQTALNDVIKQAKAAGIVVICIDHAVSSPDAINVVIDQTEWARMSANWLAEKLNGKGNVVVINGVQGHPANEARYSGAKEVFQKYPGIKVLKVVNANWDEATSQQKMADLLASQSDIDGVWSQDGMASGALRAIQAANPSKWPVVVGEARAGYLKLWYDIKQKRSDFVSYSVVNPPGVGASGIHIAMQLLQGMKIKTSELKGNEKNTLFVPIPGVVNEENFDSEYIKIKGKPDTYMLDGSITQGDAKKYFS